MTKELDPATAAEMEALAAARVFAESCVGLRSGLSGSGVSLVAIMNTLMTELWDRGFSQTDIRSAFEKAAADLNRYAAGQERR